MASIHDRRKQARSVAIALNNSGIALMCSRKHEQALATFREAVHYMKIANDADGTSDAYTQQHPDESTNARMSDSSCDVPLASNAKSQMDESSKHFPTEVISTQADPAAVLELLSCVPSAARMILPVAIQPIAEDSKLRHRHLCVNESNIEVECCILPRNYGLAFTHLAMSYLENDNESPLLYEKDADAELCEQTVLVELLLEFDLLQTSALLGMDRFQISYHLEKFQAVYFWARLQESVISIGCKSAPAA